MITIRRLLAAFLLSCVSATAQELQEWDFALSPLFLWGVSLDGDSSINGNVAPLELEFSDDILENMEAVFTVHFEARRGDWGVFTEYQYIDLEPGTEAKVGPLSADVEIDFEETMFELGGTWAFVNRQDLRWELLAGARYTDQDLKTDIDLTSPGPGAQQTLKLEGGDSSWHGIAGVRVTYGLSDRWSFIGRTDVGYGGSDNKAFNVDFMFNYRLNDWGSAFFGARHLWYDYEEGNQTGYAFDAKKQGPLAGITIHW